MINTKTKGELGRRIEYDVEHDLFHPQNIYSDEYITPTFVEYVQKLEKENTELKQAKEGKVVEHFEAYGQCRDSRRIAELEKENAELKKKNLDTQDAVTMQMYTNKANKEIADKQLTKAKEIIKKMIEAIHIWDCKNLEEVEAEAEQFLNEVEK